MGRGVLPTMIARSNRFSPLGEERDIVAELVGCIYVQPEVAVDVVVIRRVIKLVSADASLEAQKARDGAG